ncbi:MAG: hypothetical protein QXK51_11380 [Candidatus Methanomethylicia archaeon]
MDERDKIDLQFLVIHLIVMFGVFLPPGALFFIQPTIVMGLPIAVWTSWIFAYFYMLIHYTIWGLRRMRLEKKKGG